MKKLSEKEEKLIEFLKKHRPAKFSGSDLFIYMDFNPRLQIKSLGNKKIISVLDADKKYYYY
jgi:hypothetical protein